MEAVEVEMRERANLLRKCLQDNVLPPREISWMCTGGYCPFLNRCFGQDEGR
jgi:hypothetical protein